MTHLFPLGFFRCLKTDEERGVCASSGVGGHCFVTLWGILGLHVFPFIRLVVPFLLQKSVLMLAGW